MNKFDALKQFQSWPREWQELCGEYWAECEESFTLPSPTQDQLKAAPKVAVRTPIRNQMRYLREELTEVDSHLVEGRGPIAVACLMLKKYPNQRTRESWAKMARLVKKFGLQKMLDRSVDAEDRS
jgi:hypothetical protein